MRNKINEQLPNKLIEQGQKIKEWTALETLCRKLEEELCKMESFLQNVLNRIHDGINVIDREMTIIYANHTMEQWFSHALPLVGKKCYQAFQGRSEPCERCPSLRALKTGNLEMDVVTLAGPGGTKKWVEVYAFPLKNDKGSVSELIKYVREITDQKLTEEELRKQQERLQKQLLFTDALNRMAEKIAFNNGPQTTLYDLAKIIGKTLGVDQVLICDIDFAHHQVMVISKWTNSQAGASNIALKQNIYNLDLFINGAQFMWNHQFWLQSHADDINPYLIGDGSAKILHKQMNIQSLLWYPFSFHPRGYCCLLLHQVSHRRMWRVEEMEFLNAAARQMEIARQKICLLRERKEREEYLLRIRKAVEITHDAVAIVDTAGKQIDQNIAFSELFKYTPNELNAAGGQSVLYTDPQVAREAFSAALSGSQWKGEVTMRTRTGRLVPVFLCADSVKDDSGQTKEMIFIYTDISRQKRTEEVVQLSNERFFKIFNATPNLMFICAFTDVRIIDVNKSFLQVTGFQREDVIGRTMAEINIWADPGVNARLKQMVLEQEAIRNLEVNFRTKSGEVRVGLISIEVIDLDCEPTILIIVNDITEHKKLVKEMARFERLHLIGEMAAGIGHEIRNPMTTVRGFLQMLESKNELAQYREWLNLMIEELDRANKIITEFLSLAKNKTIDLKPKNLNSIVEVLFPLLEADARISDKNIILELGKIPDLLLDEKEIRQLILNLVRNGLEAMQPGGSLTISTSADGNEVVLAVKDQGKGIPPQLIEKLGTPFFTTKEHGTGLGLAVCYNIAARHNAVIKVETSSQGTTFFVRFAHQSSQYPSLLF